MLPIVPAPARGTLLYYFLPVQTGSLPSSIVDIKSLTKYDSMLDFRLSFMCCCGVGPMIHDPYWLNVR